VQVRFVEVKGPNDKLSERQIAWLQILLHAGADAAVCKVSNSSSSGSGSGSGGGSGIKAGGAAGK
jgi:hypothetical protein